MCVNVIMKIIWISRTPGKALGDPKGCLNHTHLAPNLRTGVWGVRGREGGGSWGRNTQAFPPPAPWACACCSANPAGDAGGVAGLWPVQLRTWGHGTRWEGGGLGGENGRCTACLCLLVGPENDLRTEQHWVRASLWVTERSQKLLVFALKTP